MDGMIRFLSCMACALAVSTSCFSKSPVPPVELKPWDKGAIEFETGMLWKVGGDTTFNYRIIPFIVSWRTPEWFGFHFRDGSALVVRQKFSAMANYIETGSENRYLGLSGGGVIEWWNPSATWNVFGSAGGGVGWIDSQSAPGGQGQDFTLNWYSQLGISHTLSQNWSVNASAMFQHMSNGGQTNPNPGLNALGILIGVRRHF